MAALVTWKRNQRTLCPCKRINPGIHSQKTQTSIKRFGLNVYIRFIKGGLKRLVIS